MRVVNSRTSLTSISSLGNRWLAKSLNVIQTRHLSVFTKNLAQYARATDAGEHQQVKDAFGMTKPSSQTKRMAD